MRFITKETLNKYGGDKSIIELNDILELIEQEFGIAMPLGDKGSEQQTKEMTKAISENEEVLKQIRSARANRDHPLSSYQWR